MILNVEVSFHTQCALDTMLTVVIPSAWQTYPGGRQF